MYTYPFIPGSPSEGQGLGELGDQPQGMDNGKHMWSYPGASGDGSPTSDHTKPSKTKKDLVTVAGLHYPWVGGQQWAPDLNI